MIVDTVPFKSTRRRTRQGRHTVGVPAGCEVIGVTFRGAPSGGCVNLVCAYGDDGPKGIENRTFWAYHQDGYHVPNDARFIGVAGAMTQWMIWEDRADMDADEDD